MIMEKTKKAKTQSKRQQSLEKARFQGLLLWIVIMGNNKQKMESWKSEENACMISEGNRNGDYEEHQQNQTRCV